MEAHAAHAERRRALELLGEPGGGAAPLGLVARGGVEHVRGVHDHVGRRDPGRRERGTEAIHPLGANRRLVAVVLRDGSEDLERGGAGAGRPPDRHVDAARIDGVGAEVAAHDLL
jgi:hypothetical protein